LKSIFLPKQKSNVLTPSPKHDYNTHAQVDINQPVNCYADKFMIVSNWKHPENFKLLLSHE
jgi:hypothetical protein